MLRQFLIASCLTGLIGVSLSQAADSQPSPKKLSTNPSAVALPSEPISPQSLLDLQSDFAQLSGQPAQLAQFVQPVSKLMRVSSGSLVSTAASSSQSLPIRVLVASDSIDLTVATQTDAPVLDAHGETIAVLPQDVEYAVQPNNAGIQIGDMQFPAMVQIAPNEAGLVYVNSRWYRGMLTLVNVNRELLAVNDTDLEQYLYSVVGGEMLSDWNAEALKAQAIAARSYALSHVESPVSEWYDLGSDESYQMYKGVESETSSTYAAVDETNSQVLVEDGGILTALYASTDAVSSEAHAGEGMSQVGAQKMAESGTGYAKILNHYYPSGKIHQLS